MMLSVAARKRRGDFCLDVAFELPTPGVLALFGRSGCGKSTLVNLIAGLLRPDAGRICLDDVTLFDAQRRLDVPTERRGLGYVFQDARLFPHLRVAGNLRLTDADASSDIRHIVLDFGATAMPVLEGQSIGILPPGTDAAGRPHYIRLYSVASPRDGERPNYNNLSITVKRVTEDHEGKPTRGVCSNYLCDLKAGDEVQVVGPYGSTFLMPNHPGANLLMICTGTGSAPMRAMTERRRRRRALKEAGATMLFFGARAPGELPYFGPLMKLPKDFIDVNLALSRTPAPAAG